MGVIFRMPAIVLRSTVGGIIPLLRPANSVAGGRKKLKLLVFNIRGKPVRSLCGFDLRNLAVVVMCIWIGWCKPPRTLFYARNISTENTLDLSKTVKVTTPSLSLL